jgi:para-aminobenzoate synthetase component I
LRTSINKQISNPQLFKEQLLSWSQQFREIVFLDSNHYPEKYSSYDCILATDAFTSIKTDYHNAFEDLKQYQQTTRDWLFGYLTYDLKNDIEDLKSNNYDGLAFPDLFFFQPKKLFLLKGNQLEIKYLTLCDDEVEVDYDEIVTFKNPKPKNQKPIKIEQRIAKESYLEKVSKILEHIHRGDIYEANFCMEFYAQTIINPLENYLKLNKISNAPFSVFFKSNNQFFTFGITRTVSKKRK